MSKLCPSCSGAKRKVFYLVRPAVGQLNIKGLNKAKIVGRIFIKKRGSTFSVGSFVKLELERLGCETVLTMLLTS